jgi:hypothetical protein
MRNHPAQRFGEFSTLFGISSRVLFATLNPDCAGALTLAGEGHNGVPPPDPVGAFKGTVA